MTHPSATQPLEPRPRVFYVDAIRSCAAFLVVASHVFAPVCAGMNLYSRTSWWTFNLFDSLIRPSASLFIMISGKLFLGSRREEPYLSFVKRRYSRVLLPFFVWSMIYGFVDAQAQEVPFSFGRAVLQFLKGPMEYHLWFMYLILGIYLLTPLLRRFVQSAKRKEIEILLTLWFGFLVVQFFVEGYAGYGPVVTLIDYGGFFVLGYYLDQTELSPKQEHWTAALAVAIILFNALATYIVTADHNGVLDERFYFGTTPLVAVYAAAFFLTLKSLPYERLIASMPWLRWLLKRMSQESYSMYLIHPFFITLFEGGSLGFVLTQDTGGTPMIGVALSTAAVFFACLAMSLIVKRIPYAGRLFVSGTPGDAP